ncbi:MAG: hypothetical protein ACFFCS_13205 [Candidatus Hodarchaeota archaeon]
MHDLIDLFKIMNAFLKHNSLYPYQVRNEANVGKNKVYRVLRSMTEEGSLERREVTRMRAGDPCTNYTITEQGKLEMRLLMNLLASVQEGQPERDISSVGSVKRDVMERDELDFKLYQEISLVLQDFIEEEGVLKRALDKVVKTVLSIL